MYGRSSRLSNFTASALQPAFASSSMVVSPLPHVQPFATADLSVHSGIPAERKRDRDRPGVHDIDDSNSGLSRVGRDCSPHGRLPTDHHQHLSSSSAQRRSSSSLAGSDVLTLRALIGTKDAGVVIGRQGANIKAIREVSKARVGVSGHIHGVAERVISITGTGEEIAKAYAQVARNLNQCDLRGSSLEAVESTPLTIRFLIPNSRMGRLIGKGGARINQIQKESNARLKALMHPMPNSGDRVLEMNGVPDAIHIAAYHMLETIKNQSDRPCHDRPYRPETCHFAFHNDSSLPPASSGFYSHHHSAQSVQGQQSSAIFQQNSAVSGVMGAPSYPLAANAVGMASETRNFVCPPHKVGPMIGRGGQRINRVRAETGCKINIEESTESNGDRIFSVTGYSRDVEMAIRLLEANLRRELSREIDGASNEPVVAQSSSSAASSSSTSSTSFTIAE